MVLNGMEYVNKVYGNIDRRFFPRSAGSGYAIMAEEFESCIFQRIYRGIPL